MSVATAGSRAARRTGRGYQVTTRVGDQVALVRVLALPEAPLEVVRELAVLQVDCIKSGACREPVPLPESLARLAVPDASDRRPTTALPSRGRAQWTRGRRRQRQYRRFRP
jgi:hypothetical protein